MAIPRFSHLRVNDLATFHFVTGDVPVKVIEITSGNAATFVATADRPNANKGQVFWVMDNLNTQALTTRTKSGTTLLVF